MNDLTKKKTKRSPAITAGLILAALGVFLLITMAMFASFDEVTNRFGGGKLDIVLTETQWKPSQGVRVVPNSFIDKNPVVINKEDTVSTYVFLEVTIPYENRTDLVIEKTAAEPGEAAYTNTSGANIPYYKFVATGVKADGTGTENPQMSGTFDAAQVVNSGWQLVGTPTVDTAKKTFTYVYAHADASNQLMPLLPGYSTEYPLFNKVYVQNFKEIEAAAGVTAFPDTSGDYGIYVKAYGIQANYLINGDSNSTNPAVVWNMIKPSTP